MNRRDFGGRGKHDWYTVHESIDRNKGLTPAQAKHLAEFLRITGNAVKIDPLGGKGRMGVYYRKSRGGQDVRIGTVPRDMFREWFNKHTGTETTPVYESAVSNFIAQNPQLILGPRRGNVYAWRELELGDSKKVGTARADVVIETTSDVWVVEVKYTSQFGGALVPLRSAVEKVRRYGSKIRELGWWRNRTVRLAIIWCTLDELPDYRERYYRSSELPFSHSKDTSR